MPDPAHQRRREFLIDFSLVPSSTGLGRLIRLPLRFLPRQMVIPILQGPLRGAKWIVGSGVHGNWLGSYERDKQWAMWSVLEAGQVVFDIGANVGFYSLLASRKVGSAGLVVAIEPLPENLDYIQRHIGLNRCTNVRVESLAISDRSGNASFSVSESRFMGHLAEQRDGLSVQVATLDELVGSGQLPSPHVIKVDVEGEELKLLQGAIGVVQSCHPVIFLATHGDELRDQCIGLLTRWNYQVQPIPEGIKLSRTTEFLAVYGG